jgi:RNA polymerase sigma-70 factor (ECF subfamily)
MGGETGRVDPGPCIISRMSELLTLEETFRSLCRGVVREDPARVEAALAEQLARGRAAWPMLKLDPRDFIACLAERTPAHEGGITMSALRSLHSADLYLALACRHRVSGAIELFESQMFAEISAFLARSEPSRAAIDEICQQLRERLFVAEPGAQTKLASYDGRGSLRSWLRVVAQRMALDLRRGTKRARTQPLDDATLAEMPLVDSPELSFFKEHYRSDAKLALQEALARLPAERLNVLRLHLLDGLTMEKIGALYRVNRSTVKRWLDDTRERLLSALRQRLQQRLRLSDEELEQLMALARSHLDLSLSRILKVAG